MNQKTFIEHLKQELSNVLDGVYKNGETSYAVAEKVLAVLEEMGYKPKNTTETEITFDEYQKIKKI